MRKEKLELLDYLATSRVMKSQAWSTEGQLEASSSYPREPPAAATPELPILIKTVHFLLLANPILKTRVPNDLSIRCESPLA